MNILIQNIIQAIRSMRTQGWQVAISSVSLAVGIVCLTLSANWFWAETNYDCSRPDYKNLYLLLKYEDEGRHKWWAQNHAWDEFAGLRQHTAGRGCTIGQYEDGRKMEYATDDVEKTQIYPYMSMDTCAARMLGIEALHGSMADALATAPENVAISDRMAMNLFGRTDVVGEIVYEVDRTPCIDVHPDGTYTEVNLRKTNYTVKAVFRAYEGMTNFECDLIRCLKDQYYGMSRNFGCLVHTDNPERTTELIDGYEHPEMKERKAELFPLRIAPRFSPGFQYDDFLKNYLYNIVFVVVSLLLVISAVANLVMVFTSINLARVREYALRRSMGATPWQNVQWIMIGIVPTLIIAVMLAGVIMEWTLKFAHFSWDISYVNDFYVATIAATILLCVLGMAYPIWKMRRAYKASFLGHGDGGRSHQWLVTVQCVVCAFLLFISLGMQKQLYDMINADLGYDHDNMLRLHTSADKPEGFDFYHDFSGIFRDLAYEIGKEAGAGITDVLAMQSDFFRRLCYIDLVDEENYAIAKDDPFSKDVKKQFLAYMEIPFRAVDFFNIRTTEGGKIMQQDEREGELQAYAPGGFNLVDINLPYYISSCQQQTRGSFREHRHFLKKRVNFKGVTALKQNNLARSALLFPGIIVGVEEFHNNMFKGNDAIYIKYAEGRREDAEAAVRKVLAKFDVPEDRYLLTTVDEHIAANYGDETVIADILSGLTAFSSLITLAGVFSMLLYSLRLRRRSMAIHRVMGATFSDIFRPMLTPYLLFALIGAVVAYFPAQILISKWKDFFWYGEAPGVGLMLIILSCMVLLITLIVWWQVSLSMREKPVEVLKPEA